MDNQKIGEFIKLKRKQKGLTQQELGDLVGVGFKAVSKWECGYSIPDISILKKLCNILDISIDEFLDGKKKTIVKRKFNKKFYIGLIIFITIIVISFIYIFINNINKYIDNKYDCVLIKTYRVDSVNESSDENFLFITFSQYQGDEANTIKLSKVDSKDLKEGLFYEFTFNINSYYVSKDINTIFDNSKLINIKESDKDGVNQLNEFRCK